MRVLCSSLYVAALALVLVGAFVHGSMGCLEEEKIGLLELKAAENLFWGSSGEVGDCCRWDRVTCDNKTNRVIELDLEGAIIDGSFNTSLLLPFHQLQVLDLSENGLQGFEGLLVLQKLEVLLLRWNPLTELPNLNGTPSLKVLDLSDNAININSSQWGGLKYLSSLEVLILEGNGLMGSIPPIIGTLTSLQSLSLSSNLLNDSSSMQGLCKLSRLQELDVSRNTLERNVPLCFSNLTSLRTLDLSWNNFEGSFPSSLLSSLKLLEYISLCGNGFEGSFDFSSLYNHSKLVVFNLANNRNKILKVEINSSTHPRFQLRVFRLSNCILNWETNRVTPHFLSNQYELRLVELNNNGIIRGDFPNWLFVNNSKLEFFRMRDNPLLIGPIMSLGLHSKQPYMRYFDISSNHIQGQIPPDIGFIFPNLTVLNMSHNALQGDFPPSIGNMKSLYILDLSNNNFSGVLPQNFFWACMALKTLILSNNKFHGNFPATSNFTSLSTLFLDNNNFSGEMSNIGIILDSMLLYMLDFGNNSFFGQIPNWTGNFPYLTSLVLSGNHLEGSIPTSLCKLRELEHLDLSRNKLGPSMPSCFNLSNMRYLHLQSNKLTGVIPYVLSRGRFLVILDLKDNKFWGSIPPWIGSLTSLEVLLLGGNELNDSIPSHLCRLRSMRMLDLSRNNLSGSIPPCLNNLTFGSEGAQDDMFIDAYIEGDGIDEITGEYLYAYSYESEIIEYPNEIEIESDPYVKGEEVGFTTKWRFESYEGKILPLMSAMDLSSNNLAGAIPSELGDLSHIHSLNLSWNHLSGPIPTTFPNLKAIESLDLSHNMLNGQIPPKMIELNSLSVFTVAYNNLSGKLPERQAQFATFEESSYQGNPLLCGLPLNRSCTAPPLQPPTSSDDHDNDEEEYSWGALFLWSFGGSFGVAFLGILAFLYLNNYYRELLFYFVAKHLPFLPL